LTIRCSRSGRGIKGPSGGKNYINHTLARCSKARRVIVTSKMFRPCAVKWSALEDSVGMLGDRVECGGFMGRWASTTVVITGGKFDEDTESEARRAPSTAISSGDSNGVRSLRGPDWHTICNSKHRSQLLASCVLLLNFIWSLRQRLHPMKIPGERSVGVRSLAVAEDEALCGCDIGECTSDKLTAVGLVIYTCMWWQNSMLCPHPTVVACDHSLTSPTSLRCSVCSTSVVAVW
jgi:hypothetical protein